MPEQLVSEHDRGWPPVLDGNKPAGAVSKILGSVRQGGAPASHPAGGFNRKPAAASANVSSDARI